MNDGLDVKMIWGGVVVGVIGVVVAVAGSASGATTVSVVGALVALLGFGWSGYGAFDRWNTAPDRRRRAEERARQDREAGPEQ
ncbi:hypothetical protein [Antribacter gilvus]|uniref:hypothetical protein n=1 Tax=Antribacter gilvus TaxID=2304675 RepID=UPI000F784EC5|nr:hypothetical protein [Antribacter gilvus]